MKNRPSSTCIMVSKLNVAPFQSVNSPLDAPVMRRLPSGVHLEDRECWINGKWAIKK